MGAGSSLTDSVSWWRRSWCSGRLSDRSVLAQKFAGVIPVTPSYQLRRCTDIWWGYTGHTISNSLFYRNLLEKSFHHYNIALYLTLLTHYYVAFHKRGALRHTVLSPEDIGFDYHQWKAEMDLSKMDTTKVRDNADKAPIAFKV